MKIDVKEATVTTNVPQENVTQMSISVDGMEHIMELLTNLYKDPELAVIREYYTNALDAHVEAGVVAPVKITLPTWDDPVYKVQDFGVGMSRDDIVNIYAQYGASTKRNTNDQVGAFGLGCKSALTITQQFTLVSVKFEMKTTALIAKSVSGVNTVNIVSHVPTNEGNGTTIKIPVPGSPYNFNSKAEKFFAFSKPGSVLVDGKQPMYALETARLIQSPTDPSLQVHLKPSSDGESYVIMGSVPYALSNNEILLSLERLGTKTSNSFVRMPKYFPVPIGSVDLTPSREGLRFTDKTNEVIDKCISFVVNDLKDIAVTELEAATTLEEIFEIHGRWSYMVDIDRVWKGEDVPHYLKLDSDVREITRTSYGSASHSEGEHIRLSASGERIIVTGLHADSYKKVNSYLTPYMTAKGLTTTTFIITDSKDVLTDKWVKMSTLFTFVDSADIIAIGKEQRKKDRQNASKANGTAKKSKIKYPVLSVSEREIEWVNHDEIAQDTPYVHASALYNGAGDMIRDAYKYQATRGVSDTVGEFFESVTDADEIILLGGSRTVKALEQRIKETRSLLPEITQKLKTDVSGVVTDTVANHYAVMQSSWTRFLTSTGISDYINDVKDPEIVQIINPDQTTLDEYDRFKKVSEIVRYFSHAGCPAVPIIDYSTQNRAVVRVVERLDSKYPLVGAINTWGLDGDGVQHMVKYFNAIHMEQLIDISSKS